MARSTRDLQRTLEDLTAIERSRHALSSCSSATAMNHFLISRCGRREGQSQRLIVRTGELVDPWCGTNSCPHCGSFKRSRIARAVSASGPESFATLTLAGNEFSTITAKMKALRKNLTRKGFQPEWAWSVECNGNRSHDHHVHALLHSGNPDARTLADCAKRAGFGPVVHIREAKERDPRYLWRNEKKFPRLDLTHVLWINGGQYVHTSREFFRLEGEHVPGGLDAMTRLLARDALPTLQASAECA